MARRITLKQNVANSPTNSYPVGIFKVDGGDGLGAELQGVTLVDSDGYEFDETNPFAISLSLPTASSSTSSNQSVTAVSAVALAANTSRKGGWVKNIGLIPCYASLSGTAATNAPTLLNPGDSLPLVQYGSVVYTGAVAAITAAGSTTLEVVELA